MPPKRQERKRIKRPNSSRRPALSKAFQNSTALETAFLVGLVLIGAAVLWMYQLITGNTNNDDKGPPEISPQVVMEPIQQKHKLGHLRGNTSNNNNQQQIQQKVVGESNSNNNNRGGLAHFSQIAQDLAALTPAETLARLEKDDPFGTQAFDTELLEHETKLGRVLTIQEIQQLFPCPSNNNERITLPDQRIEQKARDFRDGKRGTFLFFQHLRKAGGTNFCSLAEKNLPKNARPHYYCMPDMGWSGNKNAGYCELYYYCRYCLATWVLILLHFSSNTLISLLLSFTAH